MHVLGPQYPVPNVGLALKASGAPAGPVAVIAAGWRHDESEVEIVERAVGRKCRVVPLYAWFERLEHERPELAARHRQRQQLYRRSAELMRVRRSAALSAVRRLMDMAAHPDELLGPELAHAVDDVRAIDDQLLNRMDEIAARFPELDRPWAEAPVAELHAQAADILSDASAVLVQGGHVAILLNRMAYFGVDRLLGEIAASDKPVIAWSAGAMALTDRVVLFYDDPPQGAGDPEVLCRGLGLLPGVVLFPHAERRLRLDDPTRLEILARRFAPDRCLTLDNGAWLRFGPDGAESLGDADACRVIRPDGTLEPA